MRENVSIHSPFLMDDHKAFVAYPTDSKWYNKLYVAQTFGYIAGTGAIPYTGEFVVRPICNLDGCGIGASISSYRKGDIIPSGTFYCEVFKGPHITADYVMENGKWKQTHTYQGFNQLHDLIRFSLWKQVDYDYPLPAPLRSISSPVINLELIDEKVIEVHLRGNTDPVMYTQFIPIWSDDQQCPEGWVRIGDRENHIHRQGFFCA